MMKDNIKIGIAAALLFILIPAVSVQADQLYFIDAHSQVDHTVVPLETVISLMEQGGVTHTILSARGKLHGKVILELATQHPKRITPAVRTKGKAYDTGSPEYYKSLKAQVASGRYFAIAETLLYHAQKGSKSPEYEVYPDDKRVLAALDAAIKNQRPFVIHIEFAALHEEKKKLFMDSMERMLDDHPEEPFVLTHMGQLVPSECRLLIEHHKNIYFHTGWSNPAAVRSSKQPWVNLFVDHRFAPEWKDLFVKYPDSFIFALDNVFNEHWTDFYLEQMKYWKTAFAELPVEVAHRIAHGNAERMWRIGQRE